MAKRTGQALANIQAAAKRRKSPLVTEERRAKLVAACKARIGVPLSEKGKAHIAASNKARIGTPHTEEHKAKIRAACNSDTVLARIRAPRGPCEKLRGVPKAEESKAKNRAAHLGKTLSEEHKQKIGVAVRALGEEWRAKLKLRPPTRGSTGMTYSPEYRAKMQESLRAAWREGCRVPVHTEETKRRLALAAAKQIAQWPKPKTSLERQLASYLDCQGLDYQEQVRFGRYVVDAYVPSLNTVFEADGTFWHRDEERRQRRDAYLLGRGIAEVVHLDEQDLTRLTVA